MTLIHELVHIALGESVIQNTGFEATLPSNLDPIEVFCNQVAAEVLVPENELLEIVNLEMFKEELPRITKFFHVSPEVIMRRLLTLGKITRHDYRTYRNRQLAKYKDTPARTGGAVPYHNRLLNTSGEYFARTAFTAYYEQKITRAELASVLSNCDTKHLAKIEGTIFA
ncbi:ImmA/IrrE family metallo-endopeptidase [Candidatus Poribacteria bacterium]|nr:ImmA/IrrE family metallo-endopeptidase [Candidatus Poribacteria bacterium]